MGLMFPFNKKGRFLKCGEVSALRTLSNWKKVTDAYIACFQKYVHSLLVLYLKYEQTRQSGREQRHPFSIRPYIASIEEKLEIQHQRVEALEGTLKDLCASEERLTKIESQITHLQEAFQALSLPGPSRASSEQQKQVLLTAQSFAACHGVDYSQMQIWIDTQALTPVLSAEGPPDYLLTPDQQSLVIHYWKAQKIPHTMCDECPHYVLFGSRS